MTTCDMCGKEANIVKAKIEGTVLDLCPDCSRFGEVIETTRYRSKNLPSTMQRAPLPKRKEVIQLIVPDYADKVRIAREKMGLTQEEFAKRLNERASIMQKIETGQFKPSIEMARKLERVLRTRLVEQYDEAGEIPLSTPKSKDAVFTMADFIKDKRKK